MLIFAISITITGCGRRGMSQSDRDFAIEERLQEIETIKNDSTLKPQVKRDLVERSQLELDELRDESSSPE